MVSRSAGVVAVFTLWAMRSHLSMKLRLEHERATCQTFVLHRCPFWVYGGCMTDQPTATERGPYHVSKPVRQGQITLTNALLIFIAVAQLIQLIYGA